MSKESINECIENIIKKDFSKAKLVIAENFRNSSNKRNIGTKFALEGIISKYAVKNIDISKSLEDFKSMKKGINEKLSSIWIDDFEKGFFSVWKIFVKKAIENLDNKESVVKDPSEEKQSNKAS